MPFTVALHCEVALMLTVDGVQATWTEVMEEEEDDWMVTDAVPDFVGSWCWLQSVLRRLQRLAL